MTDPAIGTFLDAIRNHPDDDVHRLVLADYLDESGGEADRARAEFIRLQCRIAANPSVMHCSPCSASWCPRRGDCVCPHPEDEKCDPRCPLHNGGSFHDDWDGWQKREAELLTLHGKDWVGSATQEATIFGRASPEVVAWGLRFTRGFLAEIACDPEDWLTYADPIVATQVGLRKVTLSRRPDWNSDYSEYDGMTWGDIGAKARFYLQFADGATCGTPSSGEELRLTARDFEDDAMSNDQWVESVGLRLLSRSWPSLAFELLNPLFVVPPFLRVGDVVRPAIGHPRRMRVVGSMGTIEQVGTNRVQVRWSCPPDDFWDNEWMKADQLELVVGGPGGLG